MTTTDTTDTTELTRASTEPRLAGIQHVGLTVRNVEASVDWYMRVLGLERQFDEPHHHSDQGGYAVVLGTPDMSLNVGLDHHPANCGEPFDPTRTGLDHVCFQVSNIEALNAWAQRLDRVGVEHSGVYAMEGTPFRLLTFNDPDGIQLELITFAG
jgi:catechol 2,3-dioxygenase-like lactoylglutathione lyase family enzyme